MYNTKKKYAINAQLKLYNNLAINFTVAMSHYDVIAFNNL